MNAFPNPKNQILLVECNDDAEIVRIGMETGLLTEVNPGFGVEWPARTLVFGARRGYRKTGVFEEIENEGMYEVLEWSKTQYALIVDADMADDRWQAFRLVREPQSWIIPGWDSEA